MSEVDKNLHCSFCSKGAQEVKKLIAGPDVYICDECVTLCHEIIFAKGSKAAEAKVDLGDIPTPAKIKEFLDQYVIGQEYAKTVISVAVHNHYMRLTHPVIDGIDMEKSNILMAGPSGSGKTWIAQSIAKCLDVPFAIADATGITEAGYVGDDVESIISRLLQAAGGDAEKAERGIIFIDEIDKKSKKESNSGTRDISGEGVQQALLKIIEGAEVMVTPLGKRGPNAELVKINTRNILFIVGGAFVGLDKVIEKALGKNKGVGFGANVGQPSDQSELLSNVEPSHLMNFGLIPELIGRLPIIAPLHELSKDQLVRVLIEPKNAIIKQFTGMFKMEGADLEFTPEALNAIAELAIKRKTGARGLRGVLEKTLMKTQFDLPDLVQEGINKIIITEQTINDGQEPLAIRIQNDAVNSENV